MSSVYCPKTADLFLLDWLNVFLSLRQAYGLHLQVQSPCREFLISLLFSPGACSTKAECTMSQRFSETALLSAPLRYSEQKSTEKSVLFEYRVSVLLSGSLRKHPDICLVFMAAREWPVLSSHLQRTSHTQRLPLLNVIIEIGADIYSLCVWKCMKQDDCVNQCVPFKQWHV